MRGKQGQKQPERSAQKEKGPGQCLLSFPPQHVAVQCAEKPSQTRALPAEWCQRKGSAVQSSPNCLLNPVGGTSKPQLTFLPHPDFSSACTSTLRQEISPGHSTDKGSRH